MPCHLKSPPSALLLRVALQLSTTTTTTLGAVHKSRHAARGWGGVAKYDVITGACGALNLTPKTPRNFGNRGLKNAETGSSRRSGDYCSIKGESGSLITHCSFLIAHCSMTEALWPKKDLRHEIGYDKGSIQGCYGFGCSISYESLRRRGG